jgi:hypothetical protein
MSETVTHAAEERPEQEQEQPAPPPPETPQEQAITKSEQSTLDKLAKVEIDERGLRLTNMADLSQTAGFLWKSGLAPGFKSVAAVMMALAKGLELGLPPAAALAAIYVTPAGRAELMVNGALAACTLRGALLPGHYYEITGEGAEMSCTWHYCRKEWGGKWRTFTFTMKEALAAGVGGRDFKASNWGHWPKRMLRARAIGFALKDDFSDVLLGCPMEIDHVEGGLNEAPPEDARSGDRVPDMPAPATHDPIFDAVATVVERIPGEDG